MRLVTAIIKPFKVNAVRESLSLLDVQVVTLAEIKECGRQKEHSELCCGTEYATTILPKIAIEVTVNDEMLAEVIEAIAEASEMGQAGDQKIFVAPITFYVN